jgi:hypothetical protein
MPGHPATGDREGNPNAAIALGALHDQADIPPLYTMRIEAPSPR